MTIPYIRGTSETITCIIQLYNTCCAQTDNHFTTTTLQCQGQRQTGGQTGSSIQGQMLRLPGYLHGETSRNLSTRLTKHKQAMRNGDVNNHIAENHLQTKHQINWDSVTCVTYSTDYYQRLTLHS